MKKKDIQKLEKSGARIAVAKASCQALRDLLGHGQVNEDRYGNVQILLTAEAAEAAVEALGNGAKAGD